MVDESDLDEEAGLKRHDGELAVLALAFRLDSAIGRAECADKGVVYVNG
jgi:hypothetical protein